MTLGMARQSGQHDKHLEQHNHKLAATFVDAHETRKTRLISVQGKPILSWCGRVWETAGTPHLALNLKKPKSQIVGLKGIPG